VPGVFVDPRRVATNVVHLTIEPPMTAPALVAAVAREGLLVTAVDDRTVRLVTHLDVDVDACLEAAARIERGVYAYHPEYT
jgi:threonine aldolase